MRSFYLYDYEKTEPDRVTFIKKFTPIKLILAD